MKEFTARALVLGIILSLFFGVSNAYLGLKIGTTISASIPAAVLGMAIFKAFFRKATILEVNIVQTIATVGEALAAGIVFTVPALTLLGISFSNFTIILLTLLGGFLGILFMIPMRRYVIVKEDKVLPFPEGTACAKILKAGEFDGGYALVAFWGLLIGLFYKTLIGVQFIQETIEKKISFFKSTFSLDLSPSLLGVGYIIGPRISGLMFAGGLTGWFVLIPLIRIFGSTLQIFPSDLPVGQMSAERIWADYIRYIGAGTVAMGGVLSLFKILPICFRTVSTGFKELFSGFHQTAHLPKADQDISLKWLVLGTVVVVALLWLTPVFPMNLFTIILLVVLAYFFVGVTSITVGLVGSTSNPVSGMVICTLLLSSCLFAFLGWTERIYLVSVIMMSIVVNVAIALGGTTSQDLKTGYLVGATPRLQQIAEMIALFAPTIAICFSLQYLNEAYGFGSQNLPAPQAVLMAMIAQGVMEGKLPVLLISIGALIGLIFALCRVPVLPYAIGLYLPFSLSSSIMAGALFAFCTHHFSKKSEHKLEIEERGVLFSSGLIAADACLGVLFAFLSIFGKLWQSSFSIQDGYSLLLYIVIGAFITIFSLKNRVTLLK